MLEISYIYISSAMGTYWNLSGGAVNSRWGEGRLVLPCLACCHKLQKMDEWDRSPNLLIPYRHVIPVHRTRSKNDHNMW